MASDRVHTMGIPMGDKSRQCCQLVGYCLFATKSMKYSKYQVITVHHLEHQCQHSIHELAQKKMDLSTLVGMCNHWMKGHWKNKHKDVDRSQNWKPVTPPEPLPPHLPLKKSQRPRSQNTTCTTSWRSKRSWFRWRFPAGSPKQDTPWCG